MKDTLAIITPLGVSDGSIALDTPEWFSWLSEHFSFSYQSICHYTCNKRSNGKWYASKRKGDRSQGSKTLAQEYLGADGKLTKAKLEEIAKKFALPDRDYWYLKHPRPTKSAKPTEAPGAGCTGNECITVTELSSQPYEDMAKLKAQIEELKSENDALKGRVSYLLDERGLAQAKANDDARIEIERLQKLNDQLEEENLQLNRVYTQSEDISRKYLQRADKLQAQLNECQAIAKIIDRSKLTLNKDGGFYQLRGKSVIYLEDLESQGYQVGRIDLDSAVPTRSSWETRVDAVVGTL